MFNSDSKTVVGRFAPSPTGSLHLGSLYTALASFLHARSQQGQWLLRIDDLDTPRNIKGAADHILSTLDSFALHWDDTVVYQSQCLEVYQEILNELKHRQLVYPCTCSRKTLVATESDIYNGRCRDQSIIPTTDYALRVKTDSRLISFVDGLQGEVTQNLAKQQGDFVIKRKDQIIAYQFAVVVDDYQQHINQVVRGFDLLMETPKQIYLQQLLGLPCPDYLHVPVIVDEQGYKLSKQTHATAVNLTNPSKVIFELLRLLKQKPPSVLKNAPVLELINWAIAHWQPELLKNIQQAAIDTIEN